MGESPIALQGCEIFLIEESVPLQFMSVYIWIGRYWTAIQRN